MLNLTSTLLFLSTLLAPIQAAPSLETRGITVTAGFHNASADVSVQADTPQECAFQSRQSFHYWKLTGYAKPACVGRDPDESTYSCGDGKWGAPHFGDIRKTLEKQVTKDGYFESSETGNWIGTFIWPGTSAFGDRNLKPFKEFWNGKLNLKPDVKSRTWYWGYGSDKAQISYSPTTCP